MSDFCLASVEALSPSEKSGWRTDAHSPSRSNVVAKNSSQNPGAEV